MSGAPKPPVIPEPFANGADPAFITTIPDTTATAGRASYQLGFPPLTMQPVAGGGKPPFGQDVNGIFFAVSSHDFYVQAGQLFQWDATVAASIGGYAIGTLLGSTDLKTIWFNTIDANSTNPDGGGAAGWVSLFASGFQPLTGLTGGTVTLTPTQAARKVITLSGVLTSNLAVVLPTWVAPAGRWLFINNTTGSFITTVRTAGGSGVAVPQGGPSSPLEVYGDGTNIYPAVSPLIVPIDQAPTPLTLAERTNAGNINAQYFNQASALENPSLGAVFVQAVGGDGYLRKITPANFAAQIALSLFGGQVTASQVPLAAVLQYGANILASAVLTGTPTAPTAAVGTSSSQVATTAFANPDTTLANPGHSTLSGGLSFRFGSVSAANTGQPQDIAVTFDKPFNNVCLMVIPTTQRSVASNGQALNGSNFASNRTVNGATITIDDGPGGVATGTYLAIGF